MSNNPTALEAAYMVFGLDGQGWFTLTQNRMTYEDANQKMMAQPHGFHLMACFNEEGYQGIAAGIVDGQPFSSLQALKHIVVAFETYFNFNGATHEPRLFKRPEPKPEPVPPAPKKTKHKKRAGKSAAASPVVMAEVQEPQSPVARKHKRRVAA